MNKIAKEQIEKNDYDILLGICTYLRPNMLAVLLQSIARQTIFNTNEKVSILVVDNDISRSAERVFNENKINFSCDMNYVVVPDRGIPNARNAVLDYALRKDCKYIAFIDDDEVACADWLLSLYKAILGANYDVVQGPVMKILPPDAPKWAIAESKKSQLRPEGITKKTPATNNVIFSTKIATHDSKIKFSSDFALSGGSDIDFFSKARSLGFVFAWTNNAVVYESVPKSRLTLRWQFLRSYRVGAANTFITIRQSGVICAVKRHVPKAFLRIAFGPPIFLFAALTKMEVLKITSLRWVGSAMGLLTGFTGKLFNEYKKIHGN
jgi:succinoglycan biosynthesis protein ExoM